MLAAGLDGIENKIDPGPANSDNLYELSEDELRRRNITFLPTTLREALDCFEQDEVVQQALGKDYAGLLRHREARRVAAISSEYQPMGTGPLPDHALTNSLR